jgi:uncharacterized caspase-like protein
MTHQGNYSSHVSLELQATSLLPLSRFRLFVDGNPIKELAISGNEAAETVEVVLKRGKHWITAVAYNSPGFSSIPKHIFVDASQVKAEQGRLYALGVGVDIYPKMPDAELLYAKRDVITFTETLATNPAQQYEQVVSHRLLDGDATRENIHATLSDIIQQATADDTVMLYFSGHGSKGTDGKFYFLTSQATFDDVETSGLLWEDVADILTDSKAKVLVFLDACHSGAASQETVVPNDAYVAELMKANKAGMVVMASSKGRQFSFEDDTLQHGYFNYALSQALGSQREVADTNKNGVIELTELYRYVKGAVSSMAEGEQTPWISRHEIIGEFPLL